MPAKRKSETVPTPSPPAKRRTRGAAATERKRGRQESPAINDEPKTTKKTKKATKVDSAKEIATAAASPPPKGKKTTSTASKAAKKASPVEVSKTVSSPPTLPKSALKSSKKAKTSKKAIVKINLPPSPEPVVSYSSSSSALRSSYTKNKTDDEDEVISLWNQSWNALFMCLTMIGPFFLAVILVCYFLGMIHQSQAIACVGVVYTLLFLTIMGSYTVVMLPCILISRLFTSMLVSPEERSPFSDAKVNMYSRMLVLILAGLGMGVYYLC